jgi:hypothetical protein
MNQIHYIHRRKFSILNPEGSFIGTHGGFTVAYQEVKPGLIEYSVARCSDRDNFNKKLGRDIATGRLARGKIEIAKDIGLKEFRDMMYKQPV